MSTGPLPDLPVDEGARRLALGHLDDASAARTRLADPSDAEGLHDYRVALRRLGSCLRAYRGPLRSTVTGRSRRRLRRLARATNRSRDLEVHLAWLDDQRERIGEAERPGVTWTAGRLTEAHRREREKLLDADAARFPRLHDRLGAQLTEYRTTIHLDGGPRRRSTAAVTARRARAAARRLRDRLLRIRGYSSAAAIHRARIAAKHLRYLIEPFAAAVPDGEMVRERLKAFQDAFGDVHDSHVFVAELQASLPEAGRDPSAGAAALPGLAALIASLQARGRSAFEDAARTWLGETAGPRFREIDAVADAIGDLAGQGREVERKFLLRDLPPLDDAGDTLEIEQGYLPGERLVERMRRVRSRDGSAFVRTVKEGAGLTRLEIEEAVTPEVFAQFWPLTEGRRLRKRRHRIADGELTWEIDEFLDRDLVLAEVELSGPPADVEIPGWLRPHVEREVTDDPAFSNARLASDGSARTAAP